MKYDFDTPVSRKKTSALKYDALIPRWGREDLLPLWIADMDFRTPNFIIQALEKRLHQGVLGYTKQPKYFFEAIKHWVYHRHQWSIEPEQIVYAPGIVPGICTAIECFTKPGDKILIQPPVYHPFSMLICENNRKVVNNPLRLSNGRYEIDFEHFEKSVKDCKMFILCNPHNPGGRIWSKEELAQIADICDKFGVLVVSDEIHADLALPGHKHTCYATVSEKARLHSLTYMAASKAFNVAGLSSSYMITQNPELLAKYRQFTEGKESAHGHIFAYDALVAAYTQPEGEEWLHAMLEYVQENINYVNHRLTTEMPRIKAMQPEASFLIFLDCRDLNLPQDELVNFFVDGAHLALNDGASFGEEGIGWMRLNIGHPRAELKQALDQLKEAYTKYGF